MILVKKKKKNCNHFCFFNQTKLKLITVINNECSLEFLLIGLPKRFLMYNLFYYVIFHVFFSFVEMYHFQLFISRCSRSWTRRYVHTNWHVLWTHTLIKIVNNIIILFTVGNKTSNYGFFSPSNIWHSS